MALQTIRRAFLPVEKQVLSCAQKERLLRSLHAPYLSVSEMDPVTPSSVINFLRSHYIPYKTGYTCLSFVCPRHTATKQSRNSEQLYVNATTGVCVRMILCHKYCVKKYS